MKTLRGCSSCKTANEIYKWQADILEVCRIWQGGCIIRSEMLKDLNEYFMENKKLDIEFHQLQQSISFINFSTLTPKPVIHSTFDYILSIQNKNLPTNLIQAQRDYFGSHTYKRIDKEGDFTGGWSL
jgi:6-phosphogluconate dehydrogenase